VGSGVGTGRGCGIFLAQYVEGGASCSLGDSVDGDRACCSLVELARGGGSCSLGDPIDAPVGVSLLGQSVIVEPLV
jgi:hypothetical protein